MVDQDGLLVDGMNSIAAFQKPFVQDRAAVAPWPHRAARPGHAARRGSQRQADHADRRVGPARRVLRAGRARDVRGQSPAGDLPAVQPDLARGGHARRHPALERGPRGDRHRQPVPAAGARRPACSRSTRPTTRTSSRASASACIAVRARRITDTMFMAAAKALAAHVAGAQRHRQQPAAAGDGACARSRSRWRKATARQARKEGLTSMAEDQIEPAIRAKMWSPQYLPYRKATRET